MQILKRTWLSCSVAMLLAALVQMEARAADVFQQIGVGYGPGYAATNTSFSSIGGFRGNAGCGCGNSGANAAYSPGCCEYPANCCGNAWDGYCQQKRCFGLGRGGLFGGGCGQSACGSSACGVQEVVRNRAPWPVAPASAFNNCNSCGHRPFGGFFNKCCQSFSGNSCGCNSNGTTGADGVIYDNGSPSDAQPQPQPPADVPTPPTPAPENPIKATRQRST